MTDVTFKTYTLLGKVTRTFLSRNPAMDKEDKSVEVTETTNVDLTFYIVEQEEGPIERACQYFYDKLVAWTSSSSFTFTIYRKSIIGKMLPCDFYITKPQQLSNLFSPRVKFSQYFGDPNDNITKD